VGCEDLGGAGCHVGLVWWDRDLVMEVNRECVCFWERVCFWELSTMMWGQTTKESDKNAT
jgi:hypothetical protein